MLHIVHVISDLDAGRAEVQTSYVTARGLRDRIVIWGHQSDVEDLLLGLDVARFSSVFGEGLPHVLGEVTACGPPVCSQTLGMPNDLSVTQVMLWRMGSPKWWLLLGRTPWM